MEGEVPRPMEVFAKDLRFPEGPTIDVDGSLVAVELAAGCVTRFRSDGSVDSKTSVTGAPNGLALHSDGSLWLCNNGGRWLPAPSTDGTSGSMPRPGSIQRIDPSGNLEDVLTAIDDEALNAPNDLCFDRDGGLWFTDPHWPDGQHQLQPGAVCYLGRDGTARRVLVDLAFPNGIGITPDGATLVVCESAKGRVLAYPIEGEGRLGERRTWSYIGKGTTPDGLCFDESGRLLVAGHATSQVFVVPPGGGDVEEVIDFGDKGVTNLCFGGPDHTTLYVTESDQGRVRVLEWNRPGLVLVGNAA